MQIIYVNYIFFSINVAKKERFATWGIELITLVPTNRCNYKDNFTEFMIL